MVFGRLELRLLVTGASGFIGKNLLLGVPRDWEVYATYNTDRSFPRFLVDNNLEVNSIRVDLRSSRQVQHKLPRRFDACVFLASNTDTSLSVEKPVQDLDANAKTLLNTLLATRIHRIIYLSSGAVYDRLKDRVDPSLRLVPSLPYSISKLTAEHYVAFGRKRGLVDEYVVLRFFGAYGPFEPPHKMFTRMIDTFVFQDTARFEIRGDGRNFIDAMYVDDAVTAIQKVLASDVMDVTVDFACGHPMRINELVRRVCFILRHSPPRIVHKGHPAEYIEFLASPKRMQELFKFRPRISLDHGIKRLAQWLTATRRDMPPSGE